MHGREYTSGIRWCGDMSLRRRVLLVAALLVSSIIAVSHAQNPPAAPRPAVRQPVRRPLRATSRPAPRAPASAPGIKFHAAARAIPGVVIAERPEPQFGAIFDDSEEATALLKRANEAVQREDWKLTIDSLQRIVELPGDSVLRADDQTYESARRHAHRVIASLPPAGLEAYRLLYDGEAEAKYRRAIETHDEAALREIVDRFLLTRFGDRAADVLAGWWIDEGRAATAVSLLRDVQDIYPDSQIPKLVWQAKLALATALAGRPHAALAMATAWPTTAPAPTALGARLGPIRAELARSRPASPATVQEWPMFMGDAARTGLMPPVEPTFLESSPWRVNLPHDTPGPLDDAYEYQRQTRALPVMQPVTDGRTLVVKCEGRLLALDAETFDPIWQTAAPSQSLAQALRQRQAVFQQINRGVPPGETAAYDRAGRALRLFADCVGGSVAMSHGMAFTIERGAESLVLLEERLGRENNPNIVFDDARTITNQLVAYDLQTGAIRWRCGSTEEVTRRPGSPRPEEPAEELLGPVEFLAPPVPVGDDLLVPCRSASDLYAIVLAPEDGSVKRRIYLCGLGGSAVNSLEPLHPCVADGVAYVPTGRGALIALDTNTWTIRWGVHYEQTTVPTRTAFRPYVVRQPGRSWLCSPPIAAGGLLLLAPTDADYLYALDRVTGKVAWRTDRGDSLYLLGADLRHAWVVGPGVTQIELETGRRLWRREIGVPTGRGAISGNRLYLPTAEWVAVLDATSGSPLDKLDLPSGHAPFGNLLCWDGGLYDCTLKELWRFPDMVRSYERAVAAHEHNPSDASSAIRLAWLEMLRDQPSRALAALEPVRADAAQTGPRATRLADHVAHLRVEALLAMAAMPGTDAQRADSLLERARQVARLPADTVRTGLALAERLNRSGRHAEAYRQYAEIAMAPAGDVMIDASPGVRQPARFVIAARLGPIEKRLDDSQRAAIGSWLTDVLRTASRAVGGGGEAGVDRVARIADAGVLPDVGLRATLQLGIRAQRDERHEEAEYYYQDIIRRGGAPAVVAEALARLALVHLAPDELHEPVAAEGEIRRLEKDFAATPIPADALHETPTEGGSPSRGDTQAAASSGHDTVFGAQAAELLRRRIDKRIYAQHERAMGEFRLGPPGEVAYTVQHLGAAPLLFRDSRPEPLAETMLLLSNWSEVRAHNVEDGKLLWPATLRLVDEAAPAVGLAPTPPVFANPVGMGSALAAPRPYAVHDGQVMVVNSATGLHAIGLATGLRLWSRPYRPVADTYTASDAFLAAARGNLLSLDADGTLTLSQTIDGDAIRWQRDLSNAPAGGWAAIRMRGDFAVAVSRALTQASIFRTADGLHVGDVKFDQPDDKERRKVSLALFDEVICGPGGPSSVVACELAAPGVERWRLQCEQDGRPIAVTGLFKPRPDLLGVGCEMGIVKLVNPTNGQVILSAKTGLAGSGIFEGAITDDVLCMYATGGDEQTPFKVVAIDARDGHLLWHRTPEVGEYWSQLHYAYPLDNSILRAAANAIPVARLIGPQAPKAIRPTEQGEAPQIKLQLTILDKRTGQSIGEPQTTVLSNPETMGMIHYVLTWPDRIIVVGDSTYVAFRVGPASPVTQAQVSATIEPPPTGEGG